jgi:ribonuclease Z
VETQHSTASQAAEIAMKAEVEKLVIGHFSARYKDLIPLLEEARQVFPAAELALEGSIFSIQD